MPSLLDYGAIAQAKEMAGFPPKPLQPYNLFQPFEPGPAPEPSRREKVVRGLRGLLGFDNLGEYEGLLTPEQKQRAKPSLLGGLLTTVASLEPPSHQAQRRAAGEFAGSQVADTLRKQREEEARQRATMEDQRAWLTANPRPNTPEGDRDWYRAYLMEGTARGWPGMGAQAGQVLPHLLPQDAKPVPARTQVVNGVLYQEQPDGQWMPKTPVAKSAYEERPEKGGIAIYEDGKFRSWKIRPPAERDPDSSRQANYENSLRTRYFATPAVEQAALLVNAYQGIMAASQDDNPQTSLAMMYEAVKMRDPNAVREGELALQRAARSVPGWMYALWEKASKGALLTATEKQQIVEWAGEKLEQQKRVVEPVRRSFERQASRFKADAGFVAPDPFEGITLKSTPKPSGLKLKEY